MGLVPQVHLVIDFCYLGPVHMLNHGASMKTVIKEEEEEEMGEGFRVHTASQGLCRRPFMMSEPDGQRLTQKHRQAVWN